MFLYCNVLYFSFSLKVAGGSHSKDANIRAKHEKQIYQINNLHIELTIFIERWGCYNIVNNHIITFKGTLKIKRNIDFEHVLEMFKLMNLSSSRETSR